MKPPFIIQTVFGFSGGIGVEVDNITHMRNAANRLFGNDYHWSVLSPGKHQFRLCTVGATMGSNVRVGMEDNLYLEKGKLARSNAEQVARMREILPLLSFEVATPDEAREMLGLKGRKNAAA
ncbi:3-keto-5-aminohexanoate cleavage protein, partial [Mesorhizobium sp. BHbsci]